MSTVTEHREHRPQVSAERRRADIPRLGNPVVLVPGLLGFDYLRLFGVRLVGQFVGIPRALRGAGNRVLVPGLDRAPVVQRAAQLKDYLDREAPGERVHLIGYSSGGLDCRYLIAHLGMAGRVLSLTTLSCPHRGTKLIDWVVRRWAYLGWSFKLMDVPYAALADVSTEACRAFNENVPDVPGVRYFSVAARYEPDGLSPHWWLLHRAMLHWGEGPNDGIVSVASATYGESTDVWDGDHVSLANWPYPVAGIRSLWINRAAHYGRILRRLKEAGF